MSGMKRREFITLLGGAAVWPMAAGGQQRAQVRRIGILVPYTADDAEAQARVGAFLQDYSNRAGSSAATFGSTYAGPEAKETTSADTRRN
jgi:hypothetical protein